MISKTYYNSSDLEDRKPIWLVLSDLYLDTEMQKFTYLHIAKTISESPYSLEQVKGIDKYEVFPILKYNLWSTAGVWTGFKEDWLFESILESINKRKFYSFSLINLSYRLFKNMTIEDWVKIEEEFQKLKV